MKSHKNQFFLLGLLSTLSLFTSEVFAKPVAKNAGSAKTVAAASIIKPNVAITNVTTLEGNSGTTNAVFTVSLSAPSTQQVSVAYATSNDTAVAPNDFNAVANTLYFAPGETSKNIAVVVKSDTVDEIDERFNLNLSNAVNANISDSLGVGFITDDDAPPIVSIGDASVSEGHSGTKTMTFTIRQSVASSRTVSVSAKTVSAVATETTDPALAGTDYLALPATQISFAPGELTKTIGVTVNSDTFDEANETFNLVLSAPGNATLGTATAVGTINDDDAVPNLTVSDVALTEGDTGTQNAAFTVSLSAPSGRTVKVTTATADGGALAGSDYIAQLPTVMAFAPGQTSKVVNIPVKGDLTFETAETFQLKLAAPVNAVITDSAGLATITDNDPTPTLSLAAPTVLEGNSGQTSLPFVLKLSNPSSRPIIYLVKTVASATDAATAGTDYVAEPNAVVTIPAGVTQQAFNVLVNGDLSDEINEKVGLSITKPSSGIVQAYAEGTIIDDDAIPSLWVVGAIQTAEGNNGSSKLTFTVKLSVPSGKPVSVSFKTTDASNDEHQATAGSDYVAVPPTTLNFAPGDASKTVDVTINGDTINEFNEIFAVGISSPTNASIAQWGNYGIILNDDFPTVSVSGPQEIYEGSSGTNTGLVTLTLSTPTTQTVSVGYEAEIANSSATSNVDFQPLSGTIVFAPGETTRYIVFNVIGDTIPEANELISLYLLGYVGNINNTIYSGRTTITILDDDKPSLSIDSPSISEGNSGHSALDFTVSLSAPSTIPVTLSFKTNAATVDTVASGTYPAKAGEDYEEVSPTTLTFAPGETSKTASVNVSGDELYEYDEQFNGLLSAPTNATIALGTGVATITNDDSQLGVFPTVSITSIVGVAEGQSGPKTLKVPVTLFGQSGVPVTVQYATGNNYNAYDGVDYIGVSGTLTFAPGETTKDIEVSIFGDTDPEMDKAFDINLFNPVNATLGSISRAFIKIQDDDRTPSISIADVVGPYLPSQVNEGDSGTRQLNFTLTLSNPSNEPVTTTFETAPYTTPPPFWWAPDYPSATADEDYVAIPPITITFAPGEMMKTVSVTVNGDTEAENYEAFLGLLSNPVNATIDQGTGVGVIFDDDYAITAEQFNFVTEGDSGNTTATITLHLSHPLDVPVTVDYSNTTVNYTATVGVDYLAKSGTVTFAPGETSKDIEFTIIGDTLAEYEEAFIVDLANPTNASLPNSRLAVIITDNDFSSASSTSVSGGKS